MKKIQKTILCEILGSPRIFYDSYNERTTKEILMTDQSTVTALAAYVQGRHDGFKAGMIFGFGALVVVKTLRKHVNVSLNGKDKTKK